MFVFKRSDRAVEGEQSYALFSSVQAGFPSPAEDHMDKKLNLNEYLVKQPAATFFVKVEGLSMSGAGIFPDDLLVVDRSLRPQHNDIIIAVIDNEFTVKRFEKTERGARLIAENPDYLPTEIDRHTNFRVWGVVTFVLHKPKHRL